MSGLNFEETVQDRFQDRCPKHEGRVEIPLRWGGMSATGNHRSNNEDNYWIDPDGRFFLVADGMGGRTGGEQASALAVTLIAEELDRTIDFEHDDENAVRAAIDTAVCNANKYIMLAGQHLRQQGMGTTLALLVRVRETFYILGIGDSRVYWMCDDDFLQVTIDHNLAQILVRTGKLTAEQAGRHSSSHVLLRCLGSRQGETKDECQLIAVCPQHRFVLCSDGVSGVLSDSELRELVAEIDDPQLAAETIVETAEVRGSRDNMTCIVVHSGDSP